MRKLSELSEAVVTAEVLTDAFGRLGTMQAEKCWVCCSTHLLQPSRTVSHASASPFTT